MIKDLTSNLDYILIIILAIVVYRLIGRPLKGLDTL